MLYIEYCVKFRSLDFFLPDESAESRHLRPIASAFMRETSLHGLKYITESNRHISERVFWLVATVLSWGMATVFVYLVSNVFSLPEIISPS